MHRANLYPFLYKMGSNSLNCFVFLYVIIHLSFPYYYVTV
nr:MAG TPA: hypothetical protein [Caudoviricetes sp.]